MLAVGAGALIYLACNEIIPESHSHGNERRATFGLLVGVVVHHGGEGARRRMKRPGRASVMRAVDEHGRRR